MAALIIDRFEVVQVNEHQHRTCFLAPGLAQATDQRRIERAPIQQMGQAVVGRLPGQPFFLTTAIAVVPQHENQTLILSPLANVQHGEVYGEGNAQ